MRLWSKDAKMSLWLWKCGVSLYIKANRHGKNWILSPLKKHKSHSMLPWSEDDVIHGLAPHRSKYQGCREQHICKTMLEDKLLINILQECVIFMIRYVLLKTFNNKYGFIALSKYGFNFQNNCTKTLIAL